MKRIAGVKIIATLGPASDAYGIVRRMGRAGLDMARLNFSHGTVEEHRRLYEYVRRFNRAHRRRIRVLQDLEGFRIRVGRLSSESVELTRGRRVALVRGERSEEPSDGEIPFDYQGDLSMIRPGQSVYIDDGMLALEVISVAADRLNVKVLEGGILKSRKGINMPGVPFDFPAVTDKDAEDMKFGIENKVDYIALSFVRSTRDIAEARARIEPEHPNCRIMAKIECREALANVESIIEAADAVMIARGDMGVAVPIYEVPIIQKEIIALCNDRGKEVVTATQMLESMTTRRRPTRAEVADVANAILDGTDYVMLSGETASGSYPVASVKMMNEIIKHTEAARDRMGIPLIG